MAPAVDGPVNFGVIVSGLNCANNIIGGVDTNVAGAPSPVQATSSIVQPQTFTFGITVIAASRGPS